MSPKDADTEPALLCRVIDVFYDALPEMSVLKVQHPVFNRTAASFSLWVAEAVVSSDGHRSELRTY